MVPREEQRFRNGRPEGRFREERDANIEWCLRVFFVVLFIAIPTGVIVILL